MERKAQEYLKTSLGKDVLLPLLNWVEKVTSGSKGDCNPVVKRAIAIYLITDFSIADVGSCAVPFIYGNSFSIAWVIINSEFKDKSTNIIDLIDELTSIIRALSKLPEVFRDVDFTPLSNKLKSLKTQVMNDKQTAKVRLEFAKSIRATWLDIFHLNSKLLDLYNEEDQAVMQFLNIYRLIIQCKESAVRVSPEIWAEIEERMLRVPDNVTT